MPLSIFRETLRRNLASTLYWGLAFAAMGYITVVILPGAETLQNFADFLKTLPTILLRATGVGEDMAFLATPEGFLSVAFFGKMLIFFVAYPLVAGMSISAGEEESGVLEVLLSLPTPRWRIISEKFAAHSLAMVGILLVSYGGVALGVAASSVTLDMSRVQTTFVNLFPSMLFIMGLTTLAGAQFSQTKVTLGLVVAFILVSFSLDTVGSMGIGTLAENLRYLSFFRYSDSAGVMQHGLVWSNVFAFCLLGVLLMLISTRVFASRDIQMV